MASNKPERRRSGYVGFLTAGAVIIIIITVAAVPFIWIDHIKSAIYYDKIAEYGAEYGVDPMLVIAVITVESRFRPDVVSRAGAVGLMQVMPGTGELLGEEVGIEGYSEDGLKDANTNIRLGTYYLGKLDKKYDGDVLALAAYNAGEGRVDSYLGTTEGAPEEIMPSDLPWPETKRYVRSVLLLYSLLQVLAPFYGIS
ncbi:MAG: lytic transglycosylase domain-containing protein [bacterium]|nr:lytic transglycosylase domain-containing protein [bacterium]